MKLGIIGAGYIVDEFLKNSKGIENLEIVSCFSRTFSKAKDISEKYGIKKPCKTLEELLDSGIDSIYIASHSNSHLEYSTIAIERGLNVLCEKPVTTNSKELSKVLSLAEKKGVVYMEAMRLIYMPSYLKLKELLKDEYFGKIISIETSAGRISSRLYRHTLDLTGGALMDLGVYCIYSIVDILGEPNKILAEALKLDTGVDSSTTAILKYKDTIATMYCTCVSQSRGELQVLCERGTITLKDFSVADTIILRDIDNNIETIKTEKISTGMAYEIKAFLEKVALKENKDNNLSLKVMKTLDSIREKIELKYPNE